MCTATAARQAAPRYQMTDTAYEMARESEPESFLEMCIAATMAAAAPRTIAAAVATAPPAPLPVVKPAAVAKPAAAPRSAPAAAPVARKSTARLQKLATRQIAVGLYTFEHAGSRGVVKNAADGWQLIINDIPGSRRYQTKRHAVNAARLVMEAAAARSAPAPAAIAAPAPAPRPAPVAPPAPATGRRVSWRSAEAPWRREAMTAKQARHLAHLAGKMTACGLTSTSPLATQAGLNRGEASDLIDSLKSQLSGYARTPRTGTQTAVQGCGIGPFARGFCLKCGLPQSR